LIFQFLRDESVKILSFFFQKNEDSIHLPPKGGSFLEWQ